MAAQNMTNYRKQVLEDFEKANRESCSEFMAFKTSVQKDFDEFRAKANAEFAQYMREAWEKTNQEQPIQPIRIVPSVPPAVFPDFDDLDFPGDNEIPFADDLIFDWDDEKPCLYL